VNRSNRPQRIGPDPQERPQTACRCRVIGRGVDAMLGASVRRLRRRVVRDDRLDLDQVTLGSGQHVGAAYTANQATPCPCCRADPEPTRGESTAR
jgi:hypothetical protein